MKKCRQGCVAHFSDEAIFCSQCGLKLEEYTGPIVTTCYLHGSKEDNYTHGEELGLEGDALEQFVYTCYEVGLMVKVDPTTGEAKAIGIKDEKGCTVKLEKPVKV